jgi:hypothetical protein
MNRPSSGAIDLLAGRDLLRQLSGEPWHGLHFVLAQLLAEGLWKAGYVPSKLKLFQTAATRWLGLPPTISNSNYIGIGMVLIGPGTAVLGIRANVGSSGSETTTLIWIDTNGNPRLRINGLNEQLREPVDLLTLVTDTLSSATFNRPGPS